MHIVNVNRLTVTFPDRTVFKDLIWAIDDRDRVGLVGPNGAGKSTLLKAMAGIIQPDSGAVTTIGQAMIGYLPQEVTLPTGKTLLEVASVLPPRLARVEEEISQLEERLGDPDVYGDEARLAQVMEQLDAATQLYDKLGGAQHRSKVLAVLHSLGFTPEDHDLETATLSGGQKKLVALARLTLEQPEVLLLDEPDNHLDLEAKHHLEAFIRGYNGGVVIVSHDRYLLDETVNKIVEMENGKLEIYVGNYSAFAIEKEQRRYRQQQAYLSQQKTISKIEETIKRFEYWGKVFENERAVRQARSRRKMLERMEERGEIIDKVQERRLMDLQIDGWRGSTKALEVKNLVMGFNDDLLFLDVNLLVRHGERVGLIGPNGAGKSVLFRLILAQLQPLEGEIKIGPSTQIGYYSQEHQTLNGWLKRTPVELVRDIRPMQEGAAVTQLLKFAFSYEQSRQPIGTMSGGERSRLQLMCLMLQQPNLLLLDEPTNNLDIESTEVLEDALNEFEGAVLAISHDRYFLDRTVDRVVDLRDGTLTSYTGGYTEYLEVTGRLV